jgi:hypothetical protein
MDPFIPFAVHRRGIRLRHATPKQGGGAGQGLFVQSVFVNFREADGKGSSDGDAQGTVAAAAAAATGETQAAAAAPAGVQALETRFEAKTRPSGCQDKPDAVVHAHPHEPSGNAWDANEQIRQEPARFILVHTAALLKLILSPNVHLNTTQALAYVVRALGGQVEQDAVQFCYGDPTFIWTFEVIYMRCTQMKRVRKQQGRGRRIPVPYVQRMQSLCFHKRADRTAVCTCVPNPGALEVCEQVMLLDGERNVCHSMPLDNYSVPLFDGSSAAAAQGQEQAAAPTAVAAVTLRKVSREKRALAGQWGPAAAVAASGTSSAAAASIAAAGGFLDRPSWLASSSAAAAFVASASDDDAVRGRPSKRRRLDRSSVHGHDDNDDEEEDDAEEE